MSILNLIIISVLSVQVYSMDQFSKSLSSTKPYLEILADRIEDIINDGQLFDFSGLKVRKINKTRTLVGDVIIKSPLGDDITIESAVYVKQGGEYRMMPYRLLPVPFCSFAAKDKYMYPDLAKNSDFPENIAAECPLKPKSYNLRGVVYRLENIPKAAIHSGDYAFESTFKRDGNILNKVRVYSTVIQI